jgi:hypothetical protein
VLVTASRDHGLFHALASPEHRTRRERLFRRDAETNTRDAYAT